MGNKRKQKIQAGPDAYPEYDALTIDQLYDERRSLGVQLHSIGKKYQDVRMRNDWITLRIRSLKNGETGIGISDHAVIRYLERVKGLDMGAVRDEIRARVALKNVADVPDQILTDERISFAVSDGRQITTVWPDDGKEPPSHAELQARGAALAAARARERQDAPQ